MGFYILRLVCSSYKYDILTSKEVDLKLNDIKTESWKGLSDKKSYLAINVYKMGTVCMLYLTIDMFKVYSLNNLEFIESCVIN